MSESTASTPRVVTFSPICPGDTSKPAARNSSCSSAWITVHLSQIGLRRIVRDPRQMLDRRGVVQRFERSSTATACAIHDRDLAGSGRMGERSPVPREDPAP